ncbi:chemotaxis protein CheX [Clostridium sp. BSD9I1]|uniref:chemotaxis protein CheX n=1 Tax=Clostridium sp. BSD9I1 TaxID=2003589 RepID=UPI001647FA8B|nr:chemotaxis protein CheX [Clostridium sp. BSD9I1]
MKSEYINPFIEGTESVIKMLCGIEVKRQKTYLKNFPILFNQVVIMIGVIGKIKGQVCFELSIDTAKRIASAMMGGVSVLELDEISKSAVSEMGNMIMGNVSTIFESKDMRIDITPPTLLTGEKIEVSNRLPNIVIPLELEGLGTMLINVAAEEIL